MRYILFISILATTISLTTNCNKATNHYSGQVIQIDYSNISTIEDSSWIKVDDWKFMHFRSLKIGKKNEYSLPASYTVIDSAGNRAMGTEINSRGMGLYIARNLNDINKNKLKETESKYRIINPNLISVRGIIKIAKQDSSSVSIEVPENYPAKIKVLK